MYNFIKELDPSWLTSRFVASSLQDLQELGEFLSENLGLDVEPVARRRNVASAWATNIVRTLQNFFKAKDASSTPSPCSWCKSYCITACEACGLRNSHLLCAMHAHVIIAEVKKRVCRICASVAVKSTILGMSAKEKKSIVVEMLGVRVKSVEEANKILLESSNFDEGELHSSQLLAC